MKQAFKLLAVLLFTVLLAVSASAQINWMKNDGKGTNYLTWYVPKDSTESNSIYDNGKTRYVPFGGDASFATGYIWTTAPPYTVKLTVTLNSASGANKGQVVSTLFSGTLDAHNLVYKTFTIKSKDYQSKSGQYIVVIKVEDANDAKVSLPQETLFLQVYPKIVLIPRQKDSTPEINTKSFSKDILETDNIQFTISATDKENDQLKYEAEECNAYLFGNCISWVTAQETDLTFNSNTGAFSWTPGYEYVQHPDLTRKAEFRFQAVQVNKKSTPWISVIINVHDVNRDPKFDPIDPKHIKQGEDVTFKVHATDADKDKLKYSIFSTNLPKQSYTFDSKTRTFTFTHGFTSDGVYTTVFQVDDGFGGQDFAVSYIVITPENKKPQCDDKEDNDNDGKIDFGNDPGCKDKNDNDESDEKPEPQCNDGKDNDNDGKIDFPDDKGCKDKNDNDESDEKPLTQCNDGKDNDGDKLKDKKDPGCHSDGDVDNEKSYDANDNNEGDEPQCVDRIDNDKDGKKDKDDPGCHTDGNPKNDKSYKPGDNDESDVVTQCNDKKDNDGDKLVDINDPGCHTDGDAGDIDTYNPQDNNESNLMPPPKASNEPIQIDLLSAHVVDEIEAGKTLWVDVRVHNDGKKEVKNLKVEAKVIDLGVWGSSGKFTLKASKSANRNVYVALPDQVASDWYLIKITATNGKTHNSTYRLVYINGNTI